MIEIVNKYKEFYKNDVRFESANDVRRFMSRVINLRANDNMDSYTSRDLGYLCNIVLKSIELSTLEDRMIYIEEQMRKGVIK